MSMRRINRAVKSKEITLPAPIWGLNRKDPISAMEPLYAITMDNYIPMDSKVELRPGFTSYARMGTAGEKVKTLAAYHRPSYDALFAIYNNKIWNITNPASVTDMGVALSNSYVQTLQYKDYMFFVNGADTPLVYYIDNNNTAHLENWGFTGTGLTATKIINCAVSKEFLWFVEKGSLKAWYTAQAGDISGTLYSFDLSQISKLGGYLVAVVNWTIDGGIGIDDYTAFITSEGEVLVYYGSNPNNANDWSLKGSYKISKPIGYRCTMQYQGDVVIICEDGYFPMGKTLSTSNAGDSLVAFSDKIRGLVIERTSMNKDKEGWQGIIYSKKGYAIFNVPVAQGVEQHVINVATGAWCRFVGVRSWCWCLFDNRLYFGSDDEVFLFDNGYSDNGTRIEGEIEQAYNDLGAPYLKKISLINPRTASSAPYSLVVYTNTDYRKQKVNYAVNIGYGNGTKWNASKWSASWNLVGTKWADNQADEIKSQWIMNSAAGVKISVCFKTQTKGNLIDWYDTGIRYEIGSGIL